ncbi:iron chaperone [Canibacter zhoujuaniae]|uniref:iron chaperone n=1 Tax=Canibacter zhoujuaniae TaxID=2708343 RepID=UPI001AB04D1D|nr:DUF1801 domain-containing protein [Canibacter zhoujuaniae]
MSQGEILQEFFSPVLAKIKVPAHRAQALEILQWIHREFPNLKARIAWNQPMFTDHDTYIIGLSFASKHLSVSPEQAGIAYCEESLKKLKLSYTPNLFRIPWGAEPPYDLLRSVIEFNIEDKKSVTGFWR